MPLTNHTVPFPETPHTTYSVYALCFDKASIYSNNILFANKKIKHVFRSITIASAFENAKHPLYHKESMCLLPKYGSVSSLIEMHSLIIPLKLASRTRSVFLPKIRKMRGHFKLHLYRGYLL